MLDNLRLLEINDSILYVVLICYDVPSFSSDTISLICAELNVPSINQGRHLRGRLVEIVVQFPSVTIYNYTHEHNPPQHPTNNSLQQTDSQNPSPYSTTPSSAHAQS